MQPAGAKGRDGRLWFPTQDGVVVVDPAKVRRDQLAPPLVVEQIVAGTQTLLPARDSVALRPDQDTIPAIPAEEIEMVMALHKQNN